MVEPFKNIYNPTLIEGMAQHIGRVSDAFDRDLFLHSAMDGLESLEMSARAQQISEAIDLSLPVEFDQKRDILVAALHPKTGMELSEMGIDAEGIAGWAVEPVARVIARNGLHDPAGSLEALREMTMRFSAEFAVRPFFRDNTALSLKAAHGWAQDDNVHVRRLASEGSRPLLPWGIKLHTFVDDPSPLIPLLDSLKDDPSEYVRRSVANNLNDIAKNQPDLVSDLAAAWLKDAGTQRRKLVKHACRTLIKNGHVGALAAFGYDAPRLKEVSVCTVSTVTLGDRMPIELSFVALAEQTLLIDYVLHFKRANGSLSAKVFKWTEMSVKKGEAASLSKDHPYKPVTTRKDYAGQQKLTVQINGQTVGEAPFELKL